MLPSIYLHGTFTLLLHIAILWFKCNITINALSLPHHARTIHVGLSNQNAITVWKLEDETPEERDVCNYFPKHFKIVNCICILTVPDDVDGGSGGGGGGGWRVAMG